MSVLNEDLETIRDALIILSGYLPFFSGDPRKVERAERHHALREEAFAALDRIADHLEQPHVERRTARP